MTSPRQNASRPLRPRRRKAPGRAGDGRRRPAQGRGYNVEALTDRTGAIVERYEYSPYGEPTVYTGKGADAKWYTGDDVTSSRSARGNEVLFQGRSIDWESGMYYYRARMYSPGLGRFISRDPSRLGGGDLNLFRFEFNSPFDLLDPSGNVSFQMQGCKLMVQANWKVVFSNERGALPWTPVQQLVWRQAAESVISSYFSNLPYSCVSNADCCHPCKTGVSVQLSLSEGGGDIVAKVKKIKGSFRRSSVTGDKMDLDQYDIDIKAGSLGQIPILHEFGHILGLDHPGGANNSSSAYSKDPRSLMGSGNVLRVKDFERAFCSKIPGGRCTWEGK